MSASSQWMISPVLLVAPTCSALARPQPAEWSATRTMRQLAGRIFGSSIGGSLVSSAITTSSSSAG